MEFELIFRKTEGPNLILSDEPTCLGLMKLFKFEKDCFGLEK